MANYGAVELGGADGWTDAQRFSWNDRSDRGRPDHAGDSIRAGIGVIVIAVVLWFSIGFL